MKYIKLFEDFINEGEKVLDKELAQAILDTLKAKENSFAEELYLSNGDRDSVKNIYKQRLPREVAGPEKSMMSSSVLTPLAGEEVYVDGRTHLVKGDKTVLNLTPKTTWADVAKALGL